MRDEHEGTSRDDLVEVVKAYTNSDWCKERFQKILESTSTGDTVNDNDLSYTAVCHFLALEMLLYCGGCRADSIQGIEHGSWGILPNVCLMNRMCH